MNWAEHNCYSHFYICWAAQAALYHFHGIEKQLLDDKHFGVFPHARVDFMHPITKGFDDVINIPVSRYTEIDEGAVIAHDDLALLLTSPETGSALITDKTQRKIFMMNHLEYDRETLKGEYDRDANSGLETPLPQYYYPDNNPINMPNMNWRAHRNLMFLNWINMVYQGTSFDLNKVGTND